MPDDAEQPKNMAEYWAWMRLRHGVEDRERLRNHYDAVTSKVLRDVTASAFWTGLPELLNRCHEEYLVETGYPLFRVLDIPSLEAKPFGTFVHKTFRKNIIANPFWPDPPATGWVLPDTWFLLVTDTVRTRFEVKYLDGVRFLADRFRDSAGADGFESSLSLEARTEGYYAAHLDLKREFEVPRQTWDTERLDMSVEVQITTQLQEVILQLTHKLYEARRERRHVAGETAWEWDYKSEEFVANYLGHILHYVEGMIMEVRDKQGARHEV